MVQKVANDFLSQKFINELVNHNHKSTEIYFDTEDVELMVLGFQSIEHFGKINKSTFDSKRLMVHALAFLGKLGKIKMLPPHQDEVAHFVLNTNVLFDLKSLELQEIIDHLFHTVGLDKFHKISEIETPQNINLIIDSFKKKAVDLFKANYLISKIGWKNRLNHLFNFDNIEDGIILLDNEDYDLSEIIGSKIFIQLQLYFGAKRGKDKSTANFRDSLALSILHNKLEKYKHGKSNIIPIFYTTSDTISKINENSDLNQYFCFQHPSSNFPISILRGESFFITHMLFNLSENELKLYQDLFKEIEQLRQTFGIKIYELIDEMVFDKQVENIITGGVFISFWFDSMVKEQFAESILTLINYKLLSSESNRIDILDSERYELSQKIAKNLESLRIIKYCWMSINALDTFIKNNLNKSTQQFDVFIDFGLTRFSFTKCDDIQDVCNELIKLFRENPDSQKYYLAKAKLIRDIVKGINESNIEVLIKPLSIFWIFEEFKTIHFILNKMNIDYTIYPRVGVLHVSALVRMNSDKDLTSKLLKKILNYKSLKKDYTIQIGLSYIYYHLWENQYNPIFSNLTSGYLHENEDEILLALIYSKLAMDWLYISKDEKAIDAKKRELRTRKYYYTINNYLYFILRSKSSLNNIEEVIKLGEILETSFQTGEGLYWQPRFAHTLALLNIRLSFEISTLKKKYAEIANNWIKLALLNMPKRKKDYTKLQEFIDLNN